MCSHSNNLLSPKSIRTMKIKDRSLNSNAALFARSITELETAEQRYPYLRILVSIVEQEHPQLKHAQNKDQTIAKKIARLSDEGLDIEEVAEVVRVRDEERGFFYD